MNDTQVIITKYISVWGWHLIGVMFLISFLQMFIINFNFVITLSFLGVVIFCEVMANIRKMQLLKFLNECKEDTEDGNKEESCEEGGEDGRESIATSDNGTTNQC